MKSGVAATTAALLRLAADPAERRAEIVLIMTAGEETGCESAGRMVQEKVLPATIGAMVVGEPSNNVPFLGHKVVLWLRCRARGKSAHGSMPAQGENAVYKAARAVLLLEDLLAQDPPDPRLGSPTLNVGTFSGGTKINMVPDLADFTVDLRTVPGLKHEGLYRRMCDRLGPAVEVDATFYRIPKKSTIDKWREEMPEDFLFTAKVPRGVTHTRFQGEYQKRLAYFLEVMERLGRKLGPLLFQFPYYRSSEFASVSDFAPSSHCWRPSRLVSGLLWR
jgi:acetylornithine deacetylase/succinyl-diaminopimelate desuccinylase-like protein